MAGWGVCEDHVRASGGDIGKGGGDELSCGPRVRAVGCLGRGGSGDMQHVAGVDPTQEEPAGSGWVKAELLRSHISSKKSHQLNSFPNHEPDG